MKRIILISILIVLSSLTGSPYLIENPEIETHGFGTLGTYMADSTAVSIEEKVLVIDLEEVQEPIPGPGIEQFFNGNDSVEPPEARKVEEKSDVQQGMTKVQTKIKCVERILRAAVIKTYFISGRIAGLQLNGLDEISEAKALLLNSGDIILAINGQTLSSKKKAYDIFKKARKQQNMIVDLLRDGKAKKFLFDLQGAV
jgi:PDZ domain-containing secreted protein